MYWVPALPSDKRFHIITRAHVHSIGDRSSQKMFSKQDLRNSISDMQRPQVLDGLGNTVHSYRDKLGIPHIQAGNEQDAFFAQGFATAQDRLWQMDYFKRRALGRLSEILGPTEIEQDTVSKTVGLETIAENEINNFNFLFSDTNL